MYEALPEEHDRFSLPAPQRQRKKMNILCVLPALLDNLMLPYRKAHILLSNTKLQSCHCEEPFDFAQGKLRDVAIYPIEPALARDTKLRAWTVNNFQSSVSYT